MIQRGIGSIRAFDDSVGAGFAYLGDSRWFVPFLVVVSCLLIGAATPFDDVLREDSYNYLKSAMEIRSGNWIISETQPMGWPVFLATVLFVLQIDSVFGGMLIARLLSIGITAGTLIPLAAISRSMVGGAGLVLVGVCYALNPVIWFIGRSGRAEALFLCLATLSLYAFIARPGRIGNTLAAAGIAALAFHVRPHGLFLLAAILVTLAVYWWRDGRSYLKQMLSAVGLFLLIVSPQLIARYIEFGSPFHFGENSKYFVDEIEDVWAHNVPVPTLWEYLTSHTWSDYYYKFVEMGLLEVLREFHLEITLVIWIPLMYLGVTKILFFDRRHDQFALLAYWLIPLLSLVPVYHIFPTVRHIAPLIPLIYLLGAVALCRSTSLKRLGIGCIAVLAVVVAVTYIRVPSIYFAPRSAVQIPSVKDSWAIWAAMSLDGKVAIIEGGDIMDMSQHYAYIDPAVLTTSPYVQLNKIPYDQADKRIQYIRPGRYDNLEDALEQFRLASIRYLILDKHHIKRRPYLREVTSEQYKDRFEHLEYFHGGDTLRDVHIYRIKY